MECGFVDELILQDTGLGVRKRVIKLLKGMYTIIDQQAYRIDTCCRLVGMVADQDEGVRVSASGEVIWTHSVDVHPSSGICHCSPGGHMVWRYQTNSQGGYAKEIVKRHRLQLERHGPDDCRDSPSL